MKQSKKFRHSKLENLLMNRERRPSQLVDHTG